MKGDVMTGTIYEPSVFRLTFGGSNQKYGPPEVNANYKAVAVDKGGHESSLIEKTGPVQPGG